MNIRKLKLFALIVFAAAVSAVIIIPGNPGVTAMESQASGRALFAKHCARCHGGDGKGDTATGRSLDVPDLTELRPSLGRIKNVVKRGDGEMPSFAKKLTAKQIAAVSAYTKTIR